MIKDCGASHVIVGHSERRHVFGETNEWINKKMKALLTHGLKPILCIGETLEQRESGSTELVIKEQLEKGFSSINDIDNCIIAYEPVWAIGTGITANMEQVEMAHELIREIIGENHDGSNDMHILYGGSVNSGNAEDLIQIEGVDGFLIGGASLDASSFASIIRTVEEVQENIK
jgi:triosephosphate isomerase